MGMTISSGKSPVREVEVPAKSRRRSFTAEYKRKVLAEADAITQRGELGALLRREGLYSSHLVEWRRLAKSGALGALGPKKRGPKAKVRDFQRSPVARDLVHAHHGIAERDLLACGEGSLLAPD